MKIKLIVLASAFAIILPFGAMAAINAIAVVDAVKAIQTSPIPISGDTTVAELPERSLQ